MLLSRRSLAVALWSVAPGFAAASEPATAADEAPAVVEGVVFAADGGPAAGLTVFVGGLAAVTDADGAFRVRVAPGAHDVSVRGDGEIVGRVGAVQAVAGQVTEVLVTWVPGASVLTATVEAPAGGVVTGPVEDGPVGRLAGVVTDAESGQPVAGARVFVRGLVIEATTAPDGRFSLEVPAGAWELSVVAPAYASQGVPDVLVVADAETPLALDLVPAGLALDAFTVRVPAITGGTAALLDERKESSAVADVLGAEQMARSGDSSAAGALRRVTGLTLVGGRFVFVRGLGERYSTTLLNGGQLPSPEPERRVVPLDLFPAAILDSVVVQKTFSPDQPAEFGGGIVQLRTRSFPTEPLFQIIVSGAWTGRATNALGLRGDPGPTDFLGIDGGHRALDPEVQAASEEEKLVAGDAISDRGYSAEELERFAETFPNEWLPATRRIGPDLGLQLNVGGPFQLGGRKAGALLGLNYGSDYENVQFRRSFYGVSGDVVEPTNVFDFTQTTRNVRLSGLLALGVEPADGHTLESTTTVLRATDDEARLYTGFLAEESTDIRVSRLRWVERMLIVQQLRGEHPFAQGPRPVSLSWRYGYARATRLEPDRRITRYDVEATTGALLLSRRDGDANQRFFSDLLDQTHDSALDFTVPIRVRDDADAKLKFGGTAVVKARGVQSRRYSFTGGNDLTDAEREQDPEDIFTPDNLGERFELKEVTQDTDNYTGRQVLGAGYVMAEVPATPWLGLMAGLRVESSRQFVETFALFNPNGLRVPAELSTVDALPAFTATFTPIDPVQIRLGYGRTVARPELRELSPAVFLDVVGGFPTFGNPDLRRTLIDNIDLRLDWFPDKGEVVSVSGFYKRFQDPIESIIRIGADPSQTFSNASSAQNFGVEFEVRKQLGFLHAALQDLYIAGNASFIRSRVDLTGAGGIQTSTVRPLQGQSPWVVNAQIGYANPELGLDVALLYNAAGRRIVDVGSLGLPDTYELPFHALDFVANAQLPKGFELRFTASNMLDARSTFALDSGEIVQEIRPGWSVGLRLGWRWRGKEKAD